ncbi:crotonyl-CoA carboxylase/reductase [Paenibacillus sophorae]|uniref:Crotonyl-CoA carboxylase/reductase n=1 Tax=Paenibacillus sophorae TaxID=1333845 RepID=A0A1H8W561_9BACL|nr:crotonyl-CoA carboxylase/reductase [Paenibacillus sophorae]QWU13263.1 crotonyl-CoA carboxylase/reductase [Paenibacillus sophorae]SEP22587.1 crotonyl-CoA carboxylase/reductase [Paenibacillus sophorae]
MNKKIFDIGENIPVGVVPENMYALTLRKERYGEPKDSMRIETVRVPSELNEYEILVKVMAAGINHNAIWAGRSIPIDVISNSQKIDNDKRNYFIPGSDGSGVVWKIGSKVSEFKVGDEVIIQSGYLGLEKDFRHKKKGDLPNIRAWGYEVNGGSFSQFTKVQSYQCLKKPDNLTWAESGCFLVSAGTAYRMLLSWKPNEIKKDDPVLIWGGASGIGSMAIQISKMIGARPIAVVSNKEKEEFCLDLGANGIIDRSEIDISKKMPDLNDKDEFNKWRSNIKKFRSCFWESLGEKKSPTVVFEHPGENTIAASVAIADKGGMVVTCGGTSGYYGNFDLRQLWVYQKRIQGSHFATREQCVEVIKLVSEGIIKTCLTRTYTFEEAIEAHQKMAENRHPCGNSAIVFD